MAKKSKQVESTEAETNPEANAAAETEKASRGIMLTLEDGSTVRRLDYIRELWASKQYTRGEIKTKVIELGGKEIPYQIIFSATKGLEGGRVVEKVVKEKKAKGKAASTEAEAA